MPKYAYKCKQCAHAFNIFHSIKDVLKDCKKCATQGCLERIPSMILGVTNKTKDGQVVDEFIKSTKQEVQEYREQLRDREAPQDD